MKMHRSYFNRNIKCRYKLIKIKKDRYIFILSIKNIIESLIEVMSWLIQLPLGYLLAIWECTTDLPAWGRELFDHIKRLSPIIFINVIDDKDGAIECK